MWKKVFLQLKLRHYFYKENGMTFYDESGSAVAYSEDSVNIYLFNGYPVAYMLGNLVYSYKGLHLGHYENGWIRDKRGCCVFFTENARDVGLIKPIKRVRPVKNIKRLIPLKEVRHVPFIKAVDRIAWSSISGERFFMQ